jgi:hypothetical protein
MAFDIVPTSGDFDDLAKRMVSNPDIVSYMLSNGLGILDEYSEEGKKRNTGFTGAHMHIGPDRLAISDFKKLLSDYAQV